MWALGLVWEERGVSKDVRCVVDVAVNCYIVYYDMRVPSIHIGPITEISSDTTLTIVSRYLINGIVSLYKKERYSG